MRNQYRFFTEAKESHSGTHPHTPASILKPVQLSMNEGEFSTRKVFHPYKNLTIRIHEAKLFVDVAVVGKMETFVKIKLGPHEWQTNIDKQFHMNPKWNEVIF